MHMNLSFRRRGREQQRIVADTLAALDRSQAVIEFEPDGAIIRANENFLKTMGYSRAEVEGRHHSLFVDPAEVGSAEYKDFWSSLREGQTQAARFRRIAKGGAEIQIEATYNPLIGADGKVYRVVKVARDVTTESRAADDARGQLAAISRS